MHATTTVRFRKALPLRYAPSIGARFLYVIAIISLAAQYCRGDVILDWNRLAADTLLRDEHYQNPGMASRTMAMVNLAMYDAVESIIGRYETVFSHDVVAADASVDASAIQAAYRVLSSIYPAQQRWLNSQRDEMLERIPESDAKSRGVAFGEYVGAAVVIARGDDGFDRMLTYTPKGGVGAWEPDPMNPQQLAWGPEWGHLETFGIESSSQMMPPPMPELTSASYAHAFNEVKSLGARDSTTRTAEQTEIALFWAYDRLGMGTPMRLYNSILRTVAAEQGNTLEENARMFAMATTSMADAGITAWDAKFTYDFWRPVSGIRQADRDGNPATTADPNWTPLGAPGGVLADGTTINDFTPSFPTYISGHAAFGAALFQSLHNFYGTDKISFQLTSDEVPGVTRSFDSLSDAMAENGRSRVYLGVHWNFDDLVARETGIAVADFVAGNMFQSVPEPDGTMKFCLGGIIVMFCNRGRRSRKSESSVHVDM